MEGGVFPKLKIRRGMANKTNQECIKAKTKQCVMFYYFHFETKYAGGIGQFVASIILTIITGQCLPENLKLYYRLLNKCEH
jgi:hypothetical protein